MTKIGINNPNVAKKIFKDMKLDLQSKDFPEVFQMPIVLLYKSPPGTSWNASSSEPAVNSREKI